MLMRIVWFAPVAILLKFTAHPSMVSLSVALGDGLGAFDCVPAGTAMTVAASTLAAIHAEAVDVMSTPSGSYL
jgi:hypothetical protein